MASARGSFWRYGLLAMPLAFAGIPVYIHAPDYYLRNGELGLAAVGLSLFFIRALDAILDPAIGWVADRKPDWRLPSLFVGSGALILGFFLLFSPWGLNSLAWLCLTLVLATAGYSILSIQMNTLGAIWSSKKGFQIRVTTVRESWSIGGLVLASVIPGVLQLWLPETYAYILLSVVLAGMVVLAMPLFVGWYKDALQKLTMNFQSTAAEGYPDKRLGAPFFVIYAVSVLASSIPAVLVIFFIRDRLNLEPYIGLFLATYFLAGVAGMPLWRIIAARTGHLRAWQYSMVLACGSFIWAFWLPEGSLLQYLIICVLSGVALGGELSLPPALLSALIHKNSGQGSASRYFALTSFLTKAALALSAGLTLPLLGLFEFVPGEANQANALLGLAALYALLPCLLKICALVLSITLFRSEANNYAYPKNPRRINRGKLYAF